MMVELSIVIPTKNRAQTAIDTIRHSAAAGSSLEVEVIVQDCSSDTRLRDMLTAAGLSQRVEYRHTTESLSMPENWNRALARAQGEYVVLIGDDDSVSPDILSLVRWARRNQLDAVKGRDYGCYWYPDVGEASLAGTLELPRFSGDTTVVEAAPLLREYASTGDHYHHLPMIYHNLVRRSVLEQVRERSGSYVEGTSPDVYSAYAIMCEIGRFGLVDYPLTLVGASAPSNSNRWRMGVLHQHFREFADYRFTWLAPDSFALVASNMDNMVRAFENMGRTDLIAMIDYRRVYARTIVAEPTRAFAHVSKFLTVCRRLDANRLMAFLWLMGAVVAKAVLNVVRSVRSFGRKGENNRERFTEVHTLGDALAVQSQWLAEHGVKPAVERS